MATAETLRSRAFMILVATVGIAAAIWLLQTLRIVLLPLVAAFFVAILLQPPLEGLGRWLPVRLRATALPLTMLLLLGLVFGAGWGLAEIVDEVVEAGPRYEDRLVGAVGRAIAWAEARGVPVPHDPMQSQEVRTRLGEFLENALRRVWTLASGLVLVYFLVLLMLLELPMWRLKLEGLLRPKDGDKVSQALEVMASKVRRYIWVRSVMSAASAAAASLWLLAMGVDLVPLWAVLIFTLNFVPNIGSIIAVFPPSLLALIQFGFVGGLVTLAGLAVIEQIIGNYIDPLWQGRQLRVSALVILVALVFWTWLWGAAGALLAVPITVALLVAAGHVQGLRTVARVLSGTADREELEGDLQGSRPAAHHSRP